MIEYAGERLNAKQLEKRSDNKYYFEINSNLTVDGLSRQNLARYANHSCRPNCEIRIYSKRIRIWTIKKINPGDEITYDYGREYFNEYIKVKGCRCAKCCK